VVAGSGALASGMGRGGRAIRRSASRTKGRWRRGGGIGSVGEIS